MRSLIARLVVVSGSLALACGSGDGDRAPGTETFVSQPPGGGMQGLAGKGGVTGAAPSAPSASSAPRTVEEGDLYALAPDEKALFVLNGFRGLQIVDLSDPDHPSLHRNGVATTGTPVDLYLRGTVAYFTVSDSVVWGWAAGPGAVEPRGGSQVWAIDVSNPAAPHVLSRLDVEGSAVETRIVGDVLYVFSRRYGWWDYAYAPVGGAAGGGATAVAPAGGASANAFYLASFDLSDPSAPRRVQELAFDATGWEAHAHITAERVTFAQAGYDAGGPRSRFSVFDIADPKGAIRPGVVFEAPGQIIDRWAMDFAEGVFRAVLAADWTGGATLRAWTSPTVDVATPAGEGVTVGVGEHLTAARFDGPRAYVVTARSYDPLFVIDTTDPSAPTVGGAVHMPGQLEFIEPRGTRLVALGHTNENGRWQLAVSLFDVTDVASPSLTKRVAFGDSAWLGASRDDARKAFQVLDGVGLVLVPYQGWDHETYRWSGGLQLLDLDLAAGTLAARGLLEHRGAITRAFPLRGAAGRLCALSDQRLQIIDAADRGAPSERAHLDLARPVIDLAFVGGKAVELSGDFFLGDTALVVTEPLEPDAATPLAEVPIAAPQARLFAIGSNVWLLAQDWRAAGRRAWLQGVDLAEPTRPRLAGRVDLAPEDAVGLGWMGPWGYGDEATILGATLAVHRQVWRGPVAMASSAPGGGDAVPVPVATDEILLFDLADVDAPRLASRVALPGSDWSWGLTASGGALWITQFSWSPGGASEGRYALVRVDVARPEAPRLVSAVNVPGVFLAAAPGGRRIYTLETLWSSPSVTPSARTSLRALDLTLRGTARLASSVELDGYPSGALVDGGSAYVATSWWTPSGGGGRLAAVDLASMRLASTQGIASGNASAYPLRIARGKLFLSAWLGRSVVLVYDLADPARPTFERAVANPGWVRTVAVEGEYAYVPSGPYGVPMIPLTR
jgi:hypothetical protein